MTTETIFSPIAAATILNVFLFALMWRGYQIERQHGAPPWPMMAGLVAYCVCIGGFFYLKMDRPLTSPMEVFGIAMAAEAMGAVIVFGLVNAFVRLRNRPNRERIPAMLASVMLLVGIFVALF